MYDILYLYLLHPNQGIEDGKQRYTEHHKGANVVTTVPDNSQ